MFIVVYFLTTFRVMCAPKSWPKHFFAVFIICLIFVHFFSIMWGKLFFFNNLVLYFSSLPLSPHPLHSCNLQYRAWQTSFLPQSWNRFKTCLVACCTNSMFKPLASSLLFNISESQKCQTRGTLKIGQLFSKLPLLCCCNSENVGIYNPSANINLTINAMLEPQR